MITDTIKQEVIERFSNGEKLKCICVDLKIEYKQGYKILKKAGLEVTARNIELNTAMLNNIELIRKLREVDKLPYGRIGEIFGCSEYTARDFCRKHKIVAVIAGDERRKKVKKDKYKLPAIMTKLWNSELVL